MRRTLNSPTISLLDKRENERVNRASDLTGGYSYTSQFCDQQRITQETQEYRDSHQISVTLSYKNLEASRHLPLEQSDLRLLIVPEDHGKHQIRMGGSRWDFEPSTGKSRQAEENRFLSEQMMR